MKDLNYFPLDVESNIYSMTKLEFEDKTSKVLVATMDCQIHCVTYNRFKPHAKTVEFTYIPNGAKVISIGTLRRGPNDFVVGITHSLASNFQKGSARSGSSLANREMNDYSRLTTYYFNIYASGSVLPNFDLDYIAQGCQTIRLRYVPYHLYETEQVSVIDASDFTLKRTPMWLLSGGDNMIHAFCEEGPYQNFNEVHIEDCFPELANVSGLTLWIDVMNIQHGPEDLERVVALSLEDGSVRLYQSILVKTSLKFELVRKSSFDKYTTIVPSVRLFRVRSDQSRSKLRNAIKQRNLLRANDHYTKEEEEYLNLLVVSSTNPSLIFKDVLKSGLEKRVELPNSQRLDCAVTSAIGDTNQDGYNELLIGTHGREVLTFCYKPDVACYRLEQVHELNHPVFAIALLNLTGDALKDVVVLLANGILVMQVAIKDVLDVCRRRVETLLNLL